MTRRVGIVVAVIAVFAIGSIGVAAADYHTTDEYDEDDGWDSGDGWDGGSDDTDSSDDTDNGFDTSPTSTFTGVAIPLKEATRAELSTTVSEAESAYSGDSPELWLFMNQDTTAIVASETAIQIGEVEIEGYESDSGSVSVIVADSVTLDAQPQTVDSDSLSDSPDQYEFRYVESTAPVKHVPFAFETGNGNVLQKSTTGSFDSGSALADNGRLLPPTELTTHVAVNASRILNGNARGYELGEYRLSGSLMLDSHTRDTWVVDSKATVRGVVLDRPVGAPVDAKADELSWLYASDVEAQAATTQSFTEVVERANEESGFTVSTEANLVGSSISTKGALVAASACDGSETVGAAPNCVPAITDMTLLTGVAAADGESYQALPFIAANNDIQSSLVSPMSGRYRITGEVIDGQSIHPGFSGDAFVVYEMERTGDLRLSSNAETNAEADKGAIVDAIKEQLQVPSSEYDSYAESQTQQNPISDSRVSDRGNEDNVSTDDGTLQDVTADGAGFSPLAAVIGVLAPLFYIRRNP